MHQPINFNNLEPFVIILGTIIFFYIYYYFIHSSLFEKYITSKSTPSLKRLNLFLSQKLFGFIILGFIPGLLYFFLISSDFTKFGLGYLPFLTNFRIIAILVFIILIAVFSNQKINSQNNSLQLKYIKWNFFLFCINAFGWIVYLMAYEFLFRGILLFECYASFGFWPAIAINVAIYSAIHMVNGKQQTIGALFFGLVACYFTLSQGTILIPILMHIALSLGSDFFSIRLNANIKYIRQKPFNFPLK